MNAKKLRKIIAEELAVISKSAIDDTVMNILSDEGGAAGLDPIEKALKDLENDQMELPEESIEELISSVAGVKRHRDGDYIDTTQLEGKAYFTKRRLNQIVKEEYKRLKDEGLISETFKSKSTFGGRSPEYKMRMPKLYGTQMQDARRGNRLPPESSNWFRFAKHLDIGILDLDEVAHELRFKNFEHMDAAVSPRGLNQSEADRVADIMYDLYMIEDIDVYDALEK